MAGISTPTASRSGRPLPLSRVVSLVLHPDVPIEDPKWTLAAMQYGQIITHDMSMIAGSTQARKFISADLIIRIHFNFVFYCRTTLNKMLYRRWSTFGIGQHTWALLPNSCACRWSCLFYHQCKVYEFCQDHHRQR